MEGGQGGRLLFLVSVWKLEVEGGESESNCVGKPIFFIFDLIVACLGLMDAHFDLIDATFDLIDALEDEIHHLLISYGYSSMRL